MEIAMLLASQLSTESQGVTIALESLRPESLQILRVTLTNHLTRTRFVWIHTYVRESRDSGLK